MTTVGDVVLIGDPAVVEVAVRDNGEPLVDAAEAGLLVDHRLADADGLYRRLRPDVARRLLRAEDLLPSGWRLAVIEGYRPIETQLRYFSEYLAVLAGQNPALDAAQLHRLATRHIAPVLESGHPPHSTGGAVDVTLLDGDGVEVDVGCPVNATPEQSDGACYTEAPGLSTRHRRHRDILITALSGAGLVNYTPEWWHWSYGDQYWALRTGQPATRYSRVD